MLKILVLLMRKLYAHTLIRDTFILNLIDYETHKEILGETEKKTIQKKTGGHNQQKTQQESDQ